MLQTWNIAKDAASVPVYVREAQFKWSESYETVLNMVTKKESPQGLMVLDGNRAAAHGVRLCRPDVICAYPITPQTELLESLYLFQANQTMNAEFIAPEGEHSALSILRGASAAGGRTFTATSSQGLTFMYEVLINTATTRLPIVMVNVAREMIAPHSVTAGEQDIMFVRDVGWIQIHNQSCQEILDSIIMAYRLAEDPDIRIPVIVCYDGYFLSHLWEPVEVPTQEMVDRFLRPLEMNPRVDPDILMTCGPTLPSRMGTEFRYKQNAATQRAKNKFEEIEKEFGLVFGRSYGGQIEEYRSEAAELVLLAIGSCAGTAKVVVDRKRQEGMKVGLVTVRLYRPFPKERLLQALKGKKAVGVIDRNVSFGWDCGALFTDMKAALYDLGEFIPMTNFICGLCGSDITIEHISRAIDLIDLSRQGKAFQEVTWLDLE